MNWYLYLKYFQVMEIMKSTFSWTLGNVFLCCLKGIFKKILKKHFFPFQEFFFPVNISTKALIIYQKCAKKDKHIFCREKSAICRIFVVVGNTMFQKLDSFFSPILISWQFIPPKFRFILGRSTGFGYISTKGCGFHQAPMRV